MRTLTLLFALLALSAATLQAQGMLPHISTTAAPGTTVGPLLVGQRVSVQLTVRAMNGETRTLLSYKAPTEVMVLGFFSASCPQNQKDWKAIGRLYERYKDWKISLVAVNEGASMEALKKDLEDLKIDRFAILDDADRAVSRFFQVQQVPTLVILDEDGVMRYRGPVEGFSQDDKRAQPYGRKALEAVIGHVDAVPDAEPRSSGGCGIQ